MPTIDCGLSGPDSLEIHGPTLLVEIGFDANFEAGLNVRPTLLSGPLLALVDTGATESCIDATLAEDLNLPMVDSHDLAGIGGFTKVNVYLAQIYIPSLLTTIYGEAGGVHLSESGQPFSALIGRDFLRHFSMNYDGPIGSVIISND